MGNRNKTKNTHTAFDRLDGRLGHRLAHIDKTLRWLAAAGAHEHVAFIANRFVVLVVAVVVVVVLTATAAAAASVVVVVVVSIVEDGTVMVGAIFVALLLHVTAIAGAAAPLADAE